MSTSENGSTSSNQSSRDIEREAEANRAQLSETLEQLRERLSPGQLLDELLSGSKANVSGFVENLGSSIRENPMPTLLIGAGLAMMMMGGASAASRASEDDDWDRQGRGMSGSLTRDDEERFGRTRYRNESRGMSGSSSSHGSSSTGSSSMTSKASEMADNAGEYASDLAHSANDYASDIAESASDMASSAARRVREGLSSAADTVRDYVPGMGSSGGRSGSYRGSSSWQGRGSDFRGSDYRGSGRGMSRGMGMVGDVRENLSRLAHDQPLMVAAIGLAIGAGLGAALPRTRVENRFVGDTADRLKDAATEAASEGYDRAKEVVSRTAEEIQEEARKQGLTPDTIADTARHAAEDVTDRVKAVAERARTSISEGASDIGKSVQANVGEAAPMQGKPGEQRPAGTTSVPPTSTPGGAPGGATGGSASGAGAGKPQSGSGVV